MGRKPTINNNCPPGLRPRLQKSGKTYYYLDLGGKPRVEIPLGDDYIIAVQRWGELKRNQLPPSFIITIDAVWQKYQESENYTELAASTKKDYQKSIKKILEFFNDPPTSIDSIEPIHIRQFLDWRGSIAKVRANREKTLFSTLWNYARSIGYTNKANPCVGIKGFKEIPRDVYIEDNIYAAVYAEADQPTRDAIDIGYLIAQRPCDVIKLYETDIQNSLMAVQQRKTKAKLQISVIGLLKQTIARITERKKQYKVRSLKLIVDEYGKPLSQHAIYQRFAKARDKAIKQHPELAEQIRKYQISDLRAKGGTDKAIEQDMRTAQKLLGHSSVVMTERYVRRIKGEFVDPTK